MRTLHIEVRYVEEVLGTASSNPDIHREFIASKANGARSIEEEVAALGADEVANKGMTVFPKSEDGTPFTWDYQWKGFFKDSCGMLRRADGFKSKRLKAYKKEIDGLVFITPRAIPLVLPEGGAMGTCQRPLRASTAQGERVALADSETVPAGTTQTFDVHVFKDELVGYVVEWMGYGRFHGTGQWRNSGKGRFTCVVTDKPTGKVLIDTTGTE